MKWLSLLLAYLPVVLQAVTAVEATIKDAPGASKKQVVMDIITTVAAAGEKTPRGTRPADQRSGRRCGWDAQQVGCLQIADCNPGEGIAPEPNDEPAGGDVAG